MTRTKRPRRRPRTRYLWRFLGALALLLGLVVAVNGLVDPYGLLGAPLITGFNQVKSPAPDRFFKPLQVSARQPRTVFLGSSRVLMGLDPADVPQFDAYNLGIPAVTIPEEIALTRHVLVDTPARRLVLALDYVSFGDAIDYYPSFRLAILGRHAWLRGLPDLLLSQRALVRSRNTFLLSRRRAPAPYHADGLQIPPPESGPPAERILHQIDEFTDFYDAMHGYDRNLVRFDAFLGRLAARHVDAVAFVTPSHAALIELLEQTGQMPAYRTWLRRLAAICAAHGIKLWDFSGYNPVSTVPLAASGATFYDGSHFRPVVGKRILDTVLLGAPGGDFGVRLTPDTVAAHSAAQRAARAAWIERQPADLAAIAARIRADAR